MDTEATHNGTPIKAGRFFYGWVIVSVLFFISIIDGGFTYIFSAFLKPLSQEFGWTRAETAGAFSLYLLAAGLTLPLWGWLSDRRGVRVVFLLSALIDGIALVLLSVVSSLIAFYTLYFILGVGLGGIGPATIGKAVSQWFVAKRGLAMGLALVGGGGGGLLLVPLSGFLIDTYSWRSAYLGLAGLALGGMLPLVWFFLTNTPGERGLTPLGQGNPTNNATKAEGENRLEPEDWTLKAALFTSTFWLLGVAFCAGLMVGLAMIAHQVAALQDAGFTLESASAIGGITLGISMGGRLAVGWASEHARYLHPMLSLCLLMQASGIGFLLYLNALGLWAVTAFVFLFGLGYGGLVVLWPLVIGHDFGLRAFGAIAGVLGTVAASLGGAVGPIIAGAIYDSTGNYHWAFFLFIAVLLVGAGAAWVTTEPSLARLSLAPGYAPGQKQEP
ncbi:MAG: MFS transporter [Candidatus Binatia bacterium]